MYYVASNGVKTAVILPDSDPCNPRDYDHITDMVCFHKRYNLGDSHDYKDPLDFARSLAESYLGTSDIVKYIISHNTPGFKFESEGDTFQILEKTFYPEESWEETGVMVSKETKEVLGGDENIPLLLDRFGASELINMINSTNRCYVSPVFLYDHSGISISTSSFVGRGIHAEWDSGLVGFISLDKERAIDSIRVPSGKIAITSSIDKPTVYNYSIDSSDRNLPVNEILLKQGFEKVNPGEILEDNMCGFSKHLLTSDNLYKCGARLFMYDGVFEGFENETSHITLHDIATFRDEYVPPSEKDWKKFAKSYVESDVMEYNNYLCGETYGYKCYVGLDEVDSCWGFNPGYQEIESIINEELRGWYGSDLKFEANYYDDFNIEKYLEKQGLLSRDMLPKISINDLEPGKEYTAKEVMDILNKKPKLSDIIADAEKKKAPEAQNTSSEMKYER